MSQQKARSMGLEYLRVHMGLFDFAVAFLTGEYEAAVKYCSWFFEDESLAEYDQAINRGYAPRGKCFFRVGYVPIVWVPSYPVTPREQATLAHECIHAVRHLFDWASVPTDDSTEEVYAHSVAHLIASYLEKVSKNKEKSMSSNETKLEKEIQAKGLTAPRITPDDLDAKIVDEKYHVFEGTTVTVCALMLQNGFVVVGESAAASPENFDEEIGRKIARDNARNKVWALEGYLLRERLSQKEAK